MKHHHKPLPVLGYTTRRHLLLDLDSKKLDYVHYIIRLIMDRWSKVGDCLILESSHKEDGINIEYSKRGRPLMVRTLSSYHLVFDNCIGYNLCCKIVSYLAELGILNRDYVQIRQFRGDMTLRISPTITTTGIKQAPRILEYIRNHNTDRHDGLIQQYQEMLFNAYEIFRSEKLVNFYL